MNLPSIGELDRRVRLRVRSDSTRADEPGLESEYAYTSKCWAKIQAVGNAIYSGSVQSGVTVTHRVTLRFRKGITDAHEVVETFEGVDTIYRVRRVSALGGRRFSVLEVEELGQAAEPGGGVFPPETAEGAYGYV